MASYKFYLDRRSVRGEGMLPLKLMFCGRNRVSLVSLGLYLRPEQWDERLERVKGHPQMALYNHTLSKVRTEVEGMMLELVESGEVTGISASEMKKRFLKRREPKPKGMRFAEAFRCFAEKKQPSTRELYEYTLKRIEDLFGDVEGLEFEDITPGWLGDFNERLSKTSSSQNYRNIHLRNIRAVFNWAISEGVTDCYPFRKYKIKPVATRKRSMTAHELRELFEMDVEDYAVIYRDMFKLMFMLIGINTVDLFRLVEVTSEGRVEFSRAKTHRLYSIKVEPEGLAVIEKYRGEKGLLCMADRWSDHRNFRKQMNKALRLLGARRSGRGGKKEAVGRFGELSTYWARHSWATIAARLEIPKETIAAALGHGGNTVTDIYIDFDREKVDRANRRVLDWVLYGRGE